ncbi:DUF3500 domain-containing protein [Kineococcus arenarius]|uniref:DUF3500 domain-containing protein n=1 Tax=Kineococcus sp. SYSU DK007 TaxID=3383128 RepID=UPI003D7D54BE
MPRTSAPPAVDLTTGRARAAFRKPSAVLSLAAAVCLVAAGCGGSDDTTSGATDTATTAATASTDGDVQAVADAANAFITSLDDDQKALAVLEMTEENATAWSNLPCGQECRGGVPLADLSEDQQVLAEELLEAATGSGEAGYQQVEEIRAADDYLNELQETGQGGGPGSGTMPTGMPTGMPTDGAMPSGMPSGMPTDGTRPSGMPTGGAMPGGGGGGDGYGSGLYDLAILGTPGADGTWMLHFGGHHLAVNFTYADGEVSGASPYFVGVEPLTWTADDGTTYAPLQEMADSVKAVTASLSEEELAQAELTETFSDVLVGPGEDGQFPEAQSGVKVGDLTDEQKQLVLAAIRSWVGIVDDAVAEDLMATYESELDDTYVSWSGGTELTEHADYVRIDGPSVWIEFVCQNGIVLSDQIHYHTVYRDKVRDYGGEFSS